MSLAWGSDAPWSLLASLTTAALGAAGAIWRLALRIDRTSAALASQKSELAATKQAMDASAARLSDRIAQIHDDHCRLREVAAALPTRAELRDMEQRLAERIAALDGRIDDALRERNG